MSRIFIASGYQTIGRALKYVDARSYVLTGIFISLATFTPWLFHQFRLAGPTFLPMHIFVFVAGLLFGWRVGLIVGLFTPLSSYAVSGMPALMVLPQIIVELSVYGLVAGVLRQSFKLRVIWSLLGAMVAGRLALLVTVSLLYLGGEVYSPVGVAANPLDVVWPVIRLGLPGIIIQLVTIPLVIKVAERVVAR